MTSAKLVDAIKSKCTQEEAHAIVKEMPDELETDQLSPNRVGKIAFTSHELLNADLFFTLQISLFVQTLLNMGNKSFSHSFAAIAKFHPTLKVTVISTE